MAICLRDASACRTQAHRQSGIGRFNEASTNFRILEQLAEALRRSRNGSMRKRRKLGSLRYSLPSDLSRARSNSSAGIPCRNRFSIAYSQADPERQPCLLHHAAEIPIGAVLIRRCW